jgi:uncharacterized membrane protein
MNLRLAAYELAAQHGLDAERTRRLLGLLETEPPAVARRLPLVIAVLSAALAGFGVILWVAANWDLFGRFGRFALLAGVVAVSATAAIAWRGARGPAALLAMLGIGALFAYFGQTYQTGADPWQLFALWALLALPLAFAVRSDLVWMPWALVVMTAISLWTHAHVGHRWSVRPEDLGVHLVAGLAVLLLVAGLSGLVSRWTGAGLWSLRTAATLAVMMFTMLGLGGLFAQDVASQYTLALVVLAAAAALLAFGPAFDVFVISAAVLGLDTLLVAGLARLLFEGGGDTFGSLLMLGLVAAGLLAGSVSVVLGLVRRRSAGAPA